MLDDFMAYLFLFYFFGLGNGQRAHSTLFPFSAIYPTVAIAFLFKIYNGGGRLARRQGMHDSMPMPSYLRLTDSQSRVSFFLISYQAKLATLSIIKMQSWVPYARSGGTQIQDEW